MQVYFFPRLITVFYKASKSPVSLGTQCKYKHQALAQNAQLWARHDSNH